MTELSARIALGRVLSSRPFSDLPGLFVPVWTVLWQDNRQEELSPVTLTFVLQSWLSGQVSELSPCFTATTG